MSQFTGKHDEVPDLAPGDIERQNATRAQRRRLLLGAAALPSVYTLTSGAAIAAASGLNCWSTQSTTTTPQRITSAPDRWYRVQVKSGTEGQTSSVMGYCLKDTQADCTDPLKPDWSASQTYWYVNGQRTLESRGGIRNIPKTPGYGLVYVDEKGTIMTLDPALYPGVDLKYAATSCMTSIIGSTISKLG
ncbi:MAG TPA: hypothetical protein VGL25_19375 [Casimicrobiaceae bacterium]